jgi:hypothetical protein
MNSKPFLLAMILLNSIVAAAQPTRCPAGAICFSGKASEARPFRRVLNPQLEFVLRLPDGIAILPRQPDKDCRELAAVVNPPYRQHRALDFDTSYGWTAEQEGTTSPREFRFVTNCRDYFIEHERLLIVLDSSSSVPEPQYTRALADLGTLAHGKGRLWITGFKVSHAQDTPDSKLGRIEWLEFRAEISLPSTKQ